VALITPCEDFVTYSNPAYDDGSYDIGTYSILSFSFDSSLYETWREMKCFTLALVQSVSFQLGT